jgi:hypothetical protein
MCRFILSGREPSNTFFRRIRHRSIPVPRNRFHVLVHDGRAAQEKRGTTVWDGVYSLLLLSSERKAALLATRKAAQPARPESSNEERWHTPQGYYV